jgi:hypothetical protein
VRTSSVSPILFPELETIRDGIHCRERSSKTRRLLKPEHWFQDCISPSMFLHRIKLFTLAASPCGVDVSWLIFAALG